LLRIGNREIRVDFGTALGLYPGRELSTLRTSRGRGSALRGRKSGIGGADWGWGCGALEAGG
jgi:hypothetical protein